jgi:riboflavin kinase/FMN adenylyltransferase
MTNKIPIAVAIGLFDGVHLGHKEVISKCVNFKKSSVKPCVLTFKNLNKNFSQSILTESLKEEKIKKLGIEEIIYLDFEDVKSLEAEDFVKQILVNEFNVKHIVCGYDFKFSKDKKADANDLVRIGEKFGIKVIVVNPFLFNNTRVSSTNIRELLKNGEISLANTLLGEDFAFDYDVIMGNQIGRTIGVPTINQEFENGMIVPKYGVYSSYVVLNGITYPCVTNIGVKPTIGKDIKPLAETHIVGLNENLYGNKIKVSLKKFLRDEKKFSSIDELKIAVNNDIEFVKNEK